MEQRVQTTTLLITRPPDFHLLADRFKLIRYELPRHLRFRRNKNDYGQMHNCLRDRLDYPYRTFKFDRLDGELKWVVYVLYPLDSEPVPVTIPFLSDTPLPKREITFEQLEFHILLKLLQIAYFRGEGAERFVGQDFCYVYAKKIGATHICLQIDLHGDIRNQPDAMVQEFKVVGQARPFRRVEEPRRASHSYFGSTVKQGQVYFVHLKTPEIARQHQNDIYEIRTREGRRTSLLYHDLQRIDECVGRLLYDFTRGFTAYLASHGIASSSKERTFLPFVPTKGQVRLPLELLNPIYVYDNRVRPIHRLQAYLTLFTQLWPDLQFHPVRNLAQVQDSAVLVVQNCSKEDFEEKGVLYGQSDPYRDLYQNYPYLPKQSINVNPHESEDAVRDTYFSYALPQEDEEQLEQFRQKLEMALSQLYLKDVLLNERRIQQRLPLLPAKYAFIRKARYAGGPYETLLYVEDDVVRFINVGEPDGPDRRDVLLGQLGVNWDDMYKQMLLKYRRLGGNEEVKELTSYDVIIGPGLFVELEDLNERVLYNYDEITRRQAALDKPLSIDDLKLAPHYDTVRTKHHLAYSELQNRGLDIPPSARKLAGAWRGRWGRSGCPCEQTAWDAQ
jgi:hypothetical protein